MDKMRLNLKSIRQMFRKTDEQQMHTGGPSWDELMNPSKYASPDDRRSTYRRHHLGE